MAIKKTTPILDKKDLLKVLRIFFKNWYVFVFFVGIALIYANIKIQQAVSTYRVSTTVLLNTELGENLAESVVRNLGINRQSEGIANELRVINSTEVIAKTVEKMHFDVSYFITGRLKTTEVYGSLPFLVDASIHNSAFYNLPISIDVVDGKRFILSYEQNGVPQKTIKGKFDVPLSFKGCDFVITRTDWFKEQQIEEYRETKYSFKVNTRNSLINKYKHAVSVKDLDWTTIVEISMIDEIPERGIHFLDTLTQVYIESTLETRKYVIDKTIEFIDQQIREVLDVLNGYESNVESFRNNNFRYDLKTEINQTLAKLNDFDAQIEQNDIQLKAFDEVRKYLLAYNDTDLFSPPYKYAASDNFLMGQLLELYQNSLTKPNQLIGRKKDNVEYQAQMARYRYIIDNLLLYMENTGKTIRTIQASLKEQQKIYEEKVKRIPGMEKELGNLQRRLDVNQRMYEYLLQRKSENIIRKAGLIPNRKVIEPGRSAGQVSPNPSAIINYAIGVALVLALIIVFIRVTFFDTIDTAFDLKQLTDIPIIGMVNRDREGRNTYLIVENKIRSMVAESFRSIRNNLEYMATDVEKKVILVTSSRVSEGKTFTSINLATIFAKAGRKTVILEFDLHKPRVQKAFNMSNDIGISSILIGKATVAEAVKKSPIENLDVLVSGPLPPNSSELVLSNKIQFMLKELKEEYEYIIMDTPPIGIISDALVLMKYSDINLYVLKAYTAKASFVEHIDNIKENFNPKNLGIILNGVRTPGSIGYGRYGVKYGYGYGYGGYGYGYGDAKS